jgi:hypothetical protein
MIKIDKNQNPRWPPVAILDFSYIDITLERLEQGRPNLVPT